MCTLSGPSCSSFCSLCPHLEVPWALSHALLRTKCQKVMLHLPSLGQVTLYIITQCSRRALQAYQELHSFPNQFYYPTVMGFVNQDTVCD